MGIERRHTGIFLACIVAALTTLALPGFAPAKPGVLDPGFGDDGRAATAADLGSSWKRGPLHVAIAPDDSTVVASNRQLFRYLPNGQLDRDFGLNGALALDHIEGLHFRIADIGIDDRGRIVVFGTAEDTAITTRIPNYYPGGEVHPSFVVVLRFDGRGRLDPSFGGSDGIFRGDLGLRNLPGEDGSHPPLVRSVAGTIDPQRRPVLLAATYELRPTEVRSRPAWVNRLSVRFTEAGDLDLGYGVAGVTALSGDANRGIATAPGSEAPFVWGGNPRITELTRLKPDGALDTEYGQAGTRTLRPAPAAIALDRAGRLLMLERLRFGVARVSRLWPNGTPERRFGRGGRTAVRLPGKRAAVSSIVIDGRGGVLLVGTALRRRSSTIGFDEPHDFLIVGRLRPSGRLDKRFGRQGWLRTGFGRRTKVAGAPQALREPLAGVVGPQAALDSRRRLVVVTTAHSPELQPGGVVLARYLLGR